jgi:hypothetical protein
MRRRGETFEAFFRRVGDALEIHARNVRRRSLGLDPLPMPLPSRSAP